ncbi:hypothetical protein G7Y89_g5362 [Cudoniella acicularis]|uniref:PARP-type domain-containing protein n=1 Tax=Cudoniella acicularis TaxID=354080 RepID=A0A8H4RML3_9HELO|nr:hypothetical protein G7Y89_g5362 [Cudoniella acicularis]
MSYRVEAAVSGRAGCQTTECKKAGIKIDKDELRFGVWVPFEDRGSWQWRHWGCVSGKQLQNLRNYLEDPEKPGTYRWDYLDGYDDDDKSSLKHHPDLQDKVRRVVTQGFIDPEDWNGDPEMNKLGESGLRTAASKKRMREEQKNRDLELKEMQEKLAAVTAERDALLESGHSATKLNAQIEKIQNELEDHKAGKTKPAAKKRAKAESDDEGHEEKKPAKKKRATKAKKEDDGNEEAVKPARKPRAKKAVKKEENEDAEMAEASEEDKPAPAKKPRAKKVKKEEAENNEIVKNEEQAAAPAAITAPKKRASRGKKAIKEEEEADELAEAQPVEKKALAKRGRKKAVKEEPAEGAPAGLESSFAAATATSKLPTEGESSGPVKGEPADDTVNLAAPANEEASQGSAVANSGSAQDSQNTDGAGGAETHIPGIKDSDLQAEFAAAVAAGEIEDDFDAFTEGKKGEMPKKKGGRGKKATSGTSRGSRSRTASKQ